ncbi:hypothetical protein SCALM49S_01498 [Streptomyces californicus]
MPPHTVKNIAAPYTATVTPTSGKSAGARPREHRVVTEVTRSRTGGRPAAGPGRGSPSCVDPALASIDVARSKPGSERVRWICGDATDVAPMRADLATMTANVAQEIADPQAWRATLRGAYGVLRPGGRLVFETRNPAVRAWEGWNRDASRRVTQIPGVGAVESWVEVTEVNEPLVSFRWTYVFAADGETLISDSTLRFREREESEAELTAQGFTVEDVRDAPDRPGKEFVFVARRP